MRALLLLPLLAVLSVPVDASIIRVSLDHEVDPGSPGYTGPGAPPGSLEVSFLLDTLSATSSTYSIGTRNGTKCLTGFQFDGLNISDITAVGDGNTMFSGGSGEMNFRGDGAGGSCPGGFFGGLSFSDSTHTYNGSPDLFPGMSLTAFLQSEDPLRDLIMGFSGVAGTGFFGGEWGSMRFQYEGIQAANVPEPGVPVLLGAALLAFAVVRGVRGRKQVIAST